MPSKSEHVIAALTALLKRKAALPVGASIERNAALPARIPAAGAVIVRDGEPGEPEVTLSPLAYHYEHRAEVDVIVDRPPGVADEVFDTLKRSIGQAIAADRTLDGLCDWIEAEAPAPANIIIEGAEALKAATIIVVLNYSAADPLG